MTGDDEPTMPAIIVSIPIIAINIPNTIPPAIPAIAPFLIWVITASPSKIVSRQKSSAYIIVGPARLVITPRGPADWVHGAAEWLPRSYGIDPAG